MEHGTRFTECQVCKKWTRTIPDEYPTDCGLCGEGFSWETNSNQFYFVQGEFGEWESRALYERRSGKKKDELQSSSVIEWVDLKRGDDGLARNIH